MEGNGGPDVVGVCSGDAVVEEEGFGGVGAFDFEALGAVVVAAGADVVEDAGGEEESGLVGGGGPGGGFAKGDGLGV